MAKTANKKKKCLHDYRLFWKCVRCGSEEMHNCMVDAVSKDYVEVARDDHKNLEDPKCE